MSRTHSPGRALLRVIALLAVVAALAAACADEDSQSEADAVRVAPYSRAVFSDRFLSPNTITRFSDDRSRSGPAPSRVELERTCQLHFGGPLGHVGHLADSVFGLGASRTYNWDLLVTAAVLALDAANISCELFPFPDSPEY